MRYLSVCSGIEAATVAWHHMGWSPLAFSEIEKFPRAVLSHHYPTVPLHGDFTKLRDEEWIADAEVLVGGTPCQAFSVAGKRLSLADDRGNLSLEFVRLADAIDHLRHSRGARPAIVVWENVPGVLNVKDNAFGCFLGALAGSDEPLRPPRGRWTNAGLVVGPERRCAWRVLDAQYFGVAQRRRRVFVVASARDDIHPAEVLFEREGVRRHSPPRREARGAAPTIPSRSTAGGGLETDFDLDGGVICAFGGNNTRGPLDVSAALNACGTASGRQDFATETFIAQVAGTLGAGGTKAKSAGTATSQDAAAGLLVAHSLRGEGFDASEDGTGRGTPLVPIAFHPTQDPISSTDGSTHALGCGSRGGQASVACAFSAKDHGGDAGEIAPTLRAMGHGASHANGGGQVAVAQHTAVRRLTTRECERLQGFPDDYTRISDKTADGPRYKALGNSMAVPVMRWIGERINREATR